MRDRISGLERPQNERNTIRLLFWICHNLERFGTHSINSAGIRADLANWLLSDVTNEVDNTLPRSCLSQFEETFSLPLPCEEPTNKQMPMRVRHAFTFFLAEMSLRAILERIITTPDLESYTRETSEHPGFVSGIKLSPLLHELRQQLDTWALRLPTDLDWSVEPGYGAPSAIGTRLKLLYWFARFSLLRPMMLRILHDSTLQSHFRLCEPFREAVLSTLTMVKVFIMERPDIDVLMANRYVDIPHLLEKIISAKAKHS